MKVALVVLASAMIVVSLVSAENYDMSVLLMDREGEKAYAIPLEYTKTVGSFMDKVNSLTGVDNKDQHIIETVKKVITKDRNTPLDMSKVESDGRVISRTFKLSNPNY